MYYIYVLQREKDNAFYVGFSKNPTPEGPALETPGRGYHALPPEGARVELPLSC